MMQDIQRAYVQLNILVSVTLWYFLLHHFATSTRIALIRDLRNEILFRKKIKRLFASCVAMLIYYCEKNDKETTHNNDDQTV